MSKCGKGCMPECEYFTTGGCISPFNCQYKIETGYINSATSIPTYMEKQMSMTAEEIEHCLERFTMGKTTDVMNFDYAGTLAYIQRLKSENADLRERLEKAVELPCKVGDIAYYIQNGKIYYGTVVCLCFDSSSVNKIGVELPSLGISEYMPSSRCIEKREVGKTLFFTIAEAKSRLAELKGEKNDR